MTADEWKLVHWVLTILSVVGGRVAWMAFKASWKAFNTSWKARREREVRALVGSKLAFFEGEQDKRFEKASKELEAHRAELKEMRQELHECLSQCAVMYERVESINRTIERELIMARGNMSDRLLELERANKSRK